MTGWSAVHGWGAGRGNCSCAYHPQTGGCGEGCGEAGGLAAGLAACAGLVEVAVSTVVEEPFEAATASRADFAAFKQRFAAGLARGLSATPTHSAGSTGRLNAPRCGGSCPNPLVRSFG